MRRCPWRETRSAAAETGRAHRRRRVPAGGRRRRRGDRRHGCRGRRRLALPDAHGRGL